MEPHLAGWLLLTQSGGDGSNDWTDVGLLVVGGALTALGGVIAERVRFRTEMRVRKEQAEWETEQRRRERRETVYISLAEAASKLAGDIDDALSHLSAGNQPKAVTLIGNAHFAYGKLIGNMHVFAADGVRQQFAVLSDAVTKLLRLVVTDATSEEVIEANTAVTEALGRLLVRMRVDLGYKLDQPAPMPIKRNPYRDKT